MTTENSKEVLHTQGEWKYFDLGKNDAGVHQKSIREYKANGQVNVIATVFENFNSKRAELIVKAVNERQTLIDENENLNVDFAAAKAAIKVNEETANKLSNERQKLIDTLKECAEFLKEVKRMYDDLNPVGGWQYIDDGSQMYLKQINELLKP